MGARAKAKALPVVDKGADWQAIEQANKALGWAMDREKIVAWVTGPHPKVRRQRIHAMAERAREIAEELNRWHWDLVRIREIRSLGATWGGVVDRPELPGTTTWAVIERGDGGPEAEAEARGSALAFAMGWRGSGPGSGSRLSETPEVRVSRTRILVTWTVGWGA